MKYNYNDGGRALAGFKGKTGDCGVRAIAIAMQRPYREVYDEMNKHLEGAVYTSKMRGESSSRTGIHRKFFDSYMLSKGWRWVATMRIGTGCKVHLRSDELPMGRIICSVSRHYVAVIDGVVNDNHDCTRGGNRCVYGYWTLAR